jgi:predicted transcriptional regulator
MAEKRERLDVIKDMLLTVVKHKKIGPTRLIQLSNLSPAMFKEYINHLLSAGLLIESFEKKKKFYVISDKGCIFLERYKTFKHFVDELGL